MASNVLGLDGKAIINGDYDGGGKTDPSVYPPRQHGQSENVPGQDADSATSTSPDASDSTVVGPSTGLND